MRKSTVFTDAYYSETAAEFGYELLDLKAITFPLGDLSEDEVRMRWVCHQSGAEFSQAVSQREKTIVTTGIGLSGPPHIGTVGQIFRAIALQRAGLKVQLVLGDLDAYNSRGTPMDVTNELGERYESLALKLGFNSERGVIRTQSDSDYLDVLLSSFLIARVLDDHDFNEAEEDLAPLYSTIGLPIRPSFSMKQSVLLMLADFIHLLTKDGYSFVLVMLGIEEHRYTLLARKACERLGIDKSRICAIYSRIIRGLGGFPKMSKSFAGSAVDGSMSRDEIRKRILREDDPSSSAKDSVVYQMMCAVSPFSFEELTDLEQAYEDSEVSWAKAKRLYADWLADLLKEW